MAHLEMAMISFQINGETVNIDVPDDTPLLWVVRDLLKFKGSKFGCGAGLCGACSMLIDGQSMRTCILPVAAVSGKAVITIEGIGTPQIPSVVQQAWIQHSVAQCGYCQSGQIVSATALLSQNIAPSDEDIDAAMRGNICRCGTYSAIRKAIKTAAVTLQNNVQVYDPSQSATEA